jgi:hypothetical protein
MCVRRVRIRSSVGYRVPVPITMRGKSDTVSDLARVRDREAARLKRWGVDALLADLLADDLAAALNAPTRTAA